MKLDFLISDFIDILQLIITGSIALLAYLTARKINKIQIREIERRYQPYIIITSLIAYVDEECIEKEISDYVDKQNLLAQKDRMYMEYITLSNNKVRETLILNFLQNGDNIKKVQRATVIKIKNIGCQVCSYKLSEIEIIYDANVTRRLQGENIKRQKIVDENECIEICLGMIYNSAKYALCDLKRIDTKTWIDNKLDFLDAPIGENFLNYNKLIITFSLYNIRDMEYTFKIIVEVEKGIIVTHTEYIG